VYLYQQGAIQRGATDIWVELPQTAPPGSAIVYYEDVLLRTTLLKHAKLIIYVTSVLCKPVASIPIILFVNLSNVAIFLFGLLYKKLFKFRRVSQDLGRPVSVFLPPGKIYLGGNQLI